MASPCCLASHSTLCVVSTAHRIAEALRGSFMSPALMQWAVDEVARLSPHTKAMLAQRLDLDLPGGGPYGASLALLGLPPTVLVGGGAELDDAPPAAAESPPKRQRKGKAS